MACSPPWSPTRCAGKADTEGYEPDGVVTLDEAAQVHRQDHPGIGQVGRQDERGTTTAAGLRRPRRPLPADPQPGRGRQVPRPVSRSSRNKKAEAKLDAEIAEEGQKLLTRMPRLKALQELRKSYQKFADGDLTADQLKSARERIKAGMVLSDEDAARLQREDVRGPLVRQGELHQEAQPRRDGRSGHQGDVPGRRGQAAGRPEGQAHQGEGPVRQGDQGRCSRTPASRSASARTWRATRTWRWP